MKLIITERQARLIRETVTNKEVICDKCSWSWDLSEGGNDPYVCHKCGHNNSEEDFKVKKLWCIITYINTLFRLPIILLLLCTRIMLN